MRKNNLKLFFGLFIVVSVLSMWNVSAAYAVTASSNITNTTWYQGGSVVTFNFTIVTSGMNTGKNLTQINFSMTNMTLIANGTNITASTGFPSQYSSVWTCTNTSAISNVVNCTGQTGGPRNTNTGFCD